MAREFLSASTQYGISTSLPVTGPPFSIAAWAMPYGATEETVIAGLFHALTTGNNSWFGIDNSPLRGKIRYGSAGGIIAYTTNLYTIDEWNHFLFICLASNNWALVLNGDTANRATATTSSNPTPEYLYVGVDPWGGAPRDYFDGRVAELTVWNAGLSLPEAAIMSKRSHLATRPASIVRHWPMVGRHSPEIEWFNNDLLTLGGSPLVTAHPPVAYIGHEPRSLGFYKKYTSPRPSHRSI